MLKRLVFLFAILFVVSKTCSAVPAVELTTPLTKPVYVSHVVIDEVYWKPRVAQVQVVYKAGYLEGGNFVMSKYGDIKLEGAAYTAFLGAFVGVDFAQTPLENLFIGVLQTPYPGTIVEVGL